MMLNQNTYTSNREAHTMRIIFGFGVMGAVLALCTVIYMIYMAPIIFVIIASILGVSYGIGCILAYFERKKYDK